MPNSSLRSYSCHVNTPHEASSLSSTPEQVEAINLPVKQPKACRVTPCLDGSHSLDEQLSPQLSRCGKLTILGICLKISLFDVNQQLRVNLENLLNCIWWMFFKTRTSYLRLPLAMLEYSWWFHHTTSFKGQSGRGAKPPPHTVIGSWLGNHRCRLLRDCNSALGSRR